MKLKYNALVLTMISALQLTGCGGGGSDEGTPRTETRPVQTPTASSTSTSTPTPAPVQLAPLAVRTIQNNQCSSTAISVDVIFHDQNGAFISSRKTNSNGQIDTGLPENTKHVSFILKTTDSQNTLHTQVQTILNVQDGFEVDALVFNNPNTCGCSDITYNLETLIAQAPDADLHNATNSTIDLSNTENEVYACVPEQQKLLFTHSAAGYKGGLFDTSESTTIALSDDQLMASGTPLDLSNYNFEPNESINLTSYVGNEAVYNVNLPRAAINNLFSEPHNKLVIFSDLDTVSYLSTSKLSEEFTGSGFIRTHSYALTPIDNEGNTNRPQHFDNTDAYSSVYNFFMQMNANESNDVAINIKSTVSNLDAVMIKMNWSDFDHGNVSWNVFTDGQDVIPDIDFGSILPSDSMSFNNVSMEVLLLDLNTEQNFDDMRELYFESAESFEKRVDSKLFDGMASYSFTSSEQ
ncbi:hypothetical protein JF50_17695 [Pseudoalteromonas luteoviolacea]|uniref:Uncharacterized protein n=1 Tax=Pseudoalteromonas luteoviolacea TaxID=43657 RepID=A0A023PYZ1_9GAMM|nr:hypothetical protein [Pseudoalteromonas luteoviolacea]AHX39824.1 hypothetical protein [Pseudoalteromonas luteoviolacea]KID56124.1 hypothetical protein JF50_17695 [Pseudoalteromonas luteoviolacea]